MAVSEAEAVEETSAAVAEVEEALAAVVAGTETEVGVMVEVTSHQEEEEVFVVVVEARQVEVEAARLEGMAEDLAVLEAVGSVVVERLEEEVVELDVAAEEVALAADLKVERKQ